MKFLSCTLNRTLNCVNGDRLPVLGLGTWKTSPGEVYDAVTTAVKLGYRHIDCAPIYANEKEIGQALFDIVQSGAVSRAELWVTSKLWNDSHKTQDVEPALRRSLADLQLDYLDAYLIHWPVAFASGADIPKHRDGFYSLDQMPINETWRAMVECAKAGLTRHVGVCNFSVKKLQQLIDQSSMAPQINQIEMHPLLAQPKLKDFCDNNDILLTAFSPLGSRDRAAAYKPKNEPDLFEIDQINAIAELRNISPAQVLIAWAVNRGAAVIPKSVNPEHMLSNLQAAEIELSDEEMQQISELDQHYRFVNGGFFAGKNSPYTIGGIWDE